MLLYYYYFPKIFLSNKHTIKKIVQTIVISPANLLFQIKSLECSTIGN